MHKKIRLLLPLMLLIAALLLIANAAHAAATITVTTTTDDLTNNGNCTLREAVQAANTNRAVDKCPAGQGSDTITLPAGTYSLALPRSASNDEAGGDLDVSAPVTILGAGVDQTILDGADLDRVLHILADSGPVVIRSLTIQHGRTSDSDGLPGGGGIYNLAGLLLEDVKIFDNGANGFDSYAGGGILNEGELELSRVIIDQNWSEFDGLGGGIANYGTLTATDSIISGNHTWDAAGLYNASNAEANLVNTRIENNLSPNFGCAVYSSGTLTLQNSAVSGNDCSKGALYAKAGTLTVSASRFFGNHAEQGGGILVEGGTAAISDTTFSDNSLRGLVVTNGTVTLSASTINGSTGGGLQVKAGSLAVTNSTLSNNVTDFNGGGLESLGGTTRLENVTITANRAGNSGDAGSDGGGIAVSGGQVTLHNTLVAANQDGSTDSLAPDISGSVLSEGYNLIGTNAGATFTIVTGDRVGSSAQPIAPGLSPLGDFGGPTLTHDLLPGSPAIDSGDPAACPTTDQRGSPRPADGNSSGSALCDIGSVEIQPAATAPEQPALSLVLYLPALRK